MMISKQNRYTITLFVISLQCLTACTSQNWYYGAQAAQRNYCMKQPVSEYDDCMKQTDENYKDYKEKRDQLLEENQPDKTGETK